MLMNLYIPAISALDGSACSWCAECVLSFGAHCLCSVLTPFAEDLSYTKAFFRCKFLDLLLCLCRLQELDWLKGHEAKEAAAKGIAGHKLPISVA